MVYNPEVNEAIDLKSRNIGGGLISQAKAIAKKFADNYTKAYNEIEKLQKGLTQNAEVQRALMQYNEEVELDEIKISDIHKMQQDGKSAEDIAKELNLSPVFVKRILGEDREWTAQSNAKILNEFNDAQIALLKKEFDPLKNKQISTARANQLSNILDKLDDGSLQKLRDALIPFVSAVSAAKLTTRKFKGVKITNVKVPGLEGMAEENESFKDNVIKKIVKPIQDYNKKKEEPKKEEVEITETHFSIGQNVIYHGPKNPITPIKAKIIGMASPQVGAYYFIKKADGENTYAAPEQMKLDEAMRIVNEGVYKDIGVRKGDLKIAKDKRQALKDKYNAIMAGQATGDEHALGDQIRKLDMSIKKQEQELIDIMKKTGTLKKNEEKRLYVESLSALKDKAEKSGMPYNILKQVYNRGMAAWKSGHRPGAGQHQWALARVNSFVTKSSGTWGGADKDLAKKVKGD
jgi:hypothetical protein